MEAVVCERCKGQGTIPHFSHVCRGICFRCWGTGEDVTGEIRGLNAWLARARQEFKARTVALRAAKDDAARKLLKKELDLITKLGKTNRKKFDRLVADQAYLRDRAKEMA
jgi:hypothetical protein